MGVPGLKTFLKQNCPSTKRRRDIVSLTGTYHKKTSKIPTLVVDAPTCIYEIFDKIDLRCSGQFQEFKNTTEQFVDAFRRNNIKLIIFFHGWYTDDHLEKYMNKRVKEVKVMQHNMNAIKNGICDGSQMKMMKWVDIFFQLTLKVLYKDDPLVEVHAAPIDNRRTVTIADYANQNDCVAILSDDTIFLFYSDTVPVMSCKELDLTEMTTLISDPKEIRYELGINENHLKIMASLTLSEEFDMEKYNRFYDFISNGRYRPRTPKIFAPNMFPFGCILKYIKGLGNRPYQRMIDKLVADIKKHGTEELANFLRDFLMNYDVDRKPSDYYRSNVEDEHEAVFISPESIVNYFTKKLVTCDIFTMVLEVMNNGHVVIGTTPLQNEDDSTLIGHVELFRPIRQRLYGFIINSPGKERKNIIEVWATFDHEHAEESVEPISEAFSELSIIELWRNQSIEVHVRMDCLLKCFGFSLADGFLDIPIKFQPLVIVLRYMFKNPGMHISKWEIDSFIVQAISSSSDNREIFHQTSFEPLDSRACHLAGLFMDGIITYLNVVLCCRLDLQSYMPWNYFDGKKFQYYYHKMKLGLTAAALLSENEGDVEFLKNQLLVSITK